MPGETPRPTRPSAELASRLGITFRDPTLLERALVHGSYVHEHPEASGGENERLEFLGDAVVSLVISEALYARHPQDDEGVLSARRAAVVSTAGLARLARRLDLGDYLLLGEGEAQRGGRARASLLASAFEALVAAIFLDAGWRAGRAWLLAHAAAELAADSPLGALKSPKSRLQELTQRRIGERPDYRVVEISGPDHQRRFRVTVAVRGTVLGEGSGGSRRDAETTAASVALAAVDAGGGSLPLPAAPSRDEMSLAAVPAEKAPIAEARADLIAAVPPGPDTGNAAEAGPPPGGSRPPRPARGGRSSLADRG